MTDLDWSPPLTPANPAAPKPRCRRHDWGDALRGAFEACVRCGKPFDYTAARRGRNNRTRGNRQELTVARQLNGHKMGPLGLPWDVEMEGYARLQVKKLATPPGLRRIAAELDRIGSGPAMPGFVWVEPGRGGEQLIVFRLKDYAERHGLPNVEGGTGR